MPRRPPHFKVFLSIQTHPKCPGLWAINDLLATYVRIGLLLTSRFADRTDGCVIVSGRQLCEVTGCEQTSGAVQRLHKICNVSPVIFLDPRSAPDATQVPASLAPVLRQMRASQRRVWVLGLPNFAEKQFNRSKNGTRTVPSASASASASYPPSIPPAIAAPSPPTAAPRPTGRAEKARGKTKPPDSLPAADLERLRAGAPPALRAEVDELVEACLDWHRSQGRLRSDWLATCRNWLRKEAQMRAERLADRSDRVERGELRPAGAAYREATWVDSVPARKPAPIPHERWQRRGRNRGQEPRSPLPEPTDPDPPEIVAPERS